MNIDAELRRAAEVEPRPQAPPLQDKFNGTHRARATRDSTRLGSNVALARAGKASYDAAPSTDQYTAERELRKLGLPLEQAGGTALAAQIMERTVAENVYDVHVQLPPLLAPLTEWQDAPSFSESNIPAGATRIDDDTWVLEASDDLSHALVAASPTVRNALLVAAVKGGIDANVYSAFYAALQVTDRIECEQALRADSAGAPSGVKEAKAMGGVWLPAMDGELANHKRNGSWTALPSCKLPRGRRAHKLTWVFKLKRDGTAKARLCVQGCTLREGIDFDQVFSSTLRHSSARALFAFAARLGCSIRSIDWVAAYLQGEFQEGEVIYCHMPPGFEENGPDGLPLILRIEKPIYGIPQSGRRLQRTVFPFLRKNGLRPLDDSDTCVWVPVDAKEDGKLPCGEIFALGVYVDNLQLVHSAKLDADGNPTEAGTFYGKFIKELRSDWDIVDEGEMEDLLAMEVRHESNGAITLHQGKYIDKIIDRFDPSRTSAAPTPYSDYFATRLAAALPDDFTDAGAPPYPDLVRPCQERCGSIMYLANSTRPDIAFATHQLCRVMARPTPDIMLEFDHLLNYLHRTRDLGLTYAFGDEHPLEGQSDASFELHRSTSGWTIFWQRCVIAWGSRRQKSTALSSCESEIMALSECAKDMVYFRKLVGGLIPSIIRKPTDIATDNRAARDLSYNPEHHDRSKHIERRHFYVREQVENMELTVPYVKTDDNISDLLTKPLAKNRFTALRFLLMGHCNLPALADAPKPASGARG